MTGHEAFGRLSSEDFSARTTVNHMMIFLDDQIPLLRHFVNLLTKHVIIPSEGNILSRSRLGHRQARPQLESRLVYEAEPLDFDRDGSDVL